jgi:hypothetical protein
VIGSTQRPIPDNTQHSQQTDICAPLEFEPAFPGSKRPQTHVLDRLATAIDCYLMKALIILITFVVLIDYLSPTNALLLTLFTLKY